MVNDAWEQRHLVEPISDGMGGTIYNIPYKNAGYESGYINTGAQMDYITIVTLDESNDLCEAEWNNPEDALKGINGTRNKHGEIEYPNIEDILREKWSVSINEYHN